MIGNYGVIRPADPSPRDVEVIISYLPTRDSLETPILTKLNGQQVLQPMLHNEQTGGGNGIEIIGGLYTLNLPTEVFNRIGIYNIYLKPVEIRTRIIDCGVLSSNPDVRGLVFDITQVPPGFIDRFVNNGLVGYRVEYLNDDGTKVQNLFRIITSSFFAEPLNQNLSNSNQKSIRYFFSQTGTLMFCQLTPSSAPSINPNAVPFIGRPNQQIILTNTFFNPINVEVEIVEYDIDTLAIGLFGAQSRSIDDNIYTIYDRNNNIYKQYDLFEIKNNLGDTTFEVRRPRTEIDFSKSLNNLITE